VKSDDYLRRVDAALSDLPWRVRRDLMTELKGHLEELPTDEASRLGTPEAYAAEMRTAAGLERRRGVFAFLRARRPRNLILTVVLLTMIGLATGSVVWINSYQPLAIGNAYRLPNGSVDAPAGDSASVVFHQGRPFDLGLEVQNTGRFAVRVLGVPHNGPPTVALPYKARVRMFGPNRYGGDVPLRPFRPFDLQPGMRAFLELDGTFARCGAWKGTGSNLLVDFPVRYRFLWKTATAEIPLPEKLAIVFKKKNNCH
jgi:HAAS domain-containing protein